MNMDTSNDYLFALQLQEELIDLTDDWSLDLTESTSSFATNVVDLTGREIDVKKRKRSDSDGISRPFKQSSSQNSKTTESIVHHSWEALDPNPDMHGLFLAFNRQYFWGTLGAVVVQWSKKMTVCAGLCRYQSGSCSISLSEPLLKLRPRKDLVETLLHEMIHAYLFITKDRNHRDRDGHGPEFCKHMYRINMNAGTNISIYHDFHDEVRLYKQHWWRCNGPCKNNKPFYGYVKRSMNRAPGPTDRWWANHSAMCNGSFIKVKEPEGFGLKKKSAAPQVPKKLVKSENKITNFIKILDSPTKSVPQNNTKTVSKPIESEQVQQDNVFETTLCPICNDPVLTEWLNDHLQNCDQLKAMFETEADVKCKCPACNIELDRNLMNEHLDSCKMLSNVFENDLTSIPVDTIYVNCPTCDKRVKENDINEHLDVCVLESELNVEKNQIKCPCCESIFKSVEELDNHIDICLLGD